MGMDIPQSTERVLDAGDRWVIKDDYEKRMDVFAEEMSRGTAQERADLVKSVLREDGGAHGSWLTGSRIQVQ